MKNARLCSLLPVCRICVIVWGICMSDYVYERILACEDLLMWNWWARCWFKENVWWFHFVMSLSGGEWVNSKAIVHQSRQMEQRFGTRKYEELVLDCREGAKLEQEWIVRRRNWRLIVETRECCGGDRSDQGLKSTSTRCVLCTDCYVRQADATKCFHLRCLFLRVQFGRPKVLVKI